MGLMTNNEIDALKGEIKGKEMALKASQIAFEKELLGGLGEDIKKTLNPPKPKEMPLKQENKIVSFIKKIMGGF